MYKSHITGQRPRTDIKPGCKRMRQPWVMTEKACLLFIPGRSISILCTGLFQTVPKAELFELKESKKIDRLYLRFMSEW